MSSRRSSRTSHTRDTGLEGSPIHQKSRGVHGLRNGRIRGPTNANHSGNPRVIAATGLNTSVPEPDFQPP